MPSHCSFRPYLICNNGGKTVKVKFATCSTTTENDCKKKDYFKGFFWLGGGGEWLKTKLFLSIYIKILDAANGMHI